MQPKAGFSGEAHMARSNHIKPNGHARPIKTKRDFKSAVSVIKTIVDQPDRESAAEKRLQSLIREMEKFDAADDDTPAVPEEDSQRGPQRRWSDDNPDQE
jgi:hypothetical protein